MALTSFIGNPTAQAVILGFFVGGVCGYGIRIAHESTPGLLPPAGAARAAAPGGGGGGYPGGGGGMGGGRASGPRNGANLAALVRNLDTIQKAQGKGLTPAQATSLVPLLSGIKAADKIPDKDAESQIAKIKAVLTPDQNKAIEDMTPARRGGGPGGGGAPGGGRGGAGGGGYPGGGGGAPGGGMGQSDPEKPFASDRARQPLDDLVKLLQTK